MNTPSIAWMAPPEKLAIHKDEMHVWRAELDIPAEFLDDLKIFLSSEEIERANRFYFSKDRERFIVAHACVRTVLSHYLMTGPEKLSFIHNSHGKPALSNGSGEFPLEFNLSHSQRLSLVAITRGRNVGVDVEAIRSEFGGLKIARRFFSPEEYRVLSSLPEEQQSEAFFRCWTRKEAYIKAKGMGLSLPLDQFDVSVHPEAPAELLNFNNDPQEAARWTMIQVDPTPGYSGSVIAEGRSLSLKLWDWLPQISLNQAYENNFPRSGS